jgi:hypothetical protein
MTCIKARENFQAGVAGLNRENVHFFCYQCPSFRSFPQGCLADIVTVE